MVSATIFAFVSALAMATSAAAHMQMTSPPPFRSKWNPNVKEVDYDYSMTSPLGEYPCKGYIDPTAPSVATWAAGSTINYELAGTAVHGGGSCQIVMSYDMGKTWNVIFSIMGGCVIESLTEAVTIPKEAPSGEALFGWNWFNKLGNREMYQNCAVVTITGGGSGFDSDDFPEPFVANVAAAPGCGTQEGIEVVFPKPGKNVKYGGMYASGGATPGAGITGTCAAGAIAPPSAGTSSPASAPSPSTVVSAPVGGETLYAPSSAINPATSPAIPSAAVSSASAPSSVVSQAAASSAPASPPKKCKRRRDKLTAPAPARRHERLVRRSAHERLVRRRIQRDISAEQLSL